MAFLLLLFPRWPWFSLSSSFLSSSRQMCSIIFTPARSLKALVQLRLIESFIYMHFISIVYRCFSYCNRLHARVSLALCNLELGFTSESASLYSPFPCIPVFLSLRVTVFLHPIPHPLSFFQTHRVSFPSHLSVYMFGRYSLVIVVVCMLIYLRQSVHNIAKGFANQAPQWR